MIKFTCLRVVSLLALVATRSFSTGFILTPHSPKNTILWASSPDVGNTLFQAASQRSVPSSELLPLLQNLESSPEPHLIPRDLVQGSFELIFSSAVADLPLIGSLLDGYLPNKETIRFDLKGGKLSLQVYTLPFVPSIDTEGENLTYDQTTSTLKYTVKGKSRASTWTVLYADETLLAAKSSVTGLNVIKRL